MHNIWVLKESMSIKNKINYKKYYCTIYVVKKYVFIFLKHCKKHSFIFAEEKKMFLRNIYLFEICCIVFADASHKIDAMLQRIQQLF